MARDNNISCVLYGPGKVRFEERAIPEIQDAHDVLIRIAYVGVCGSDVHLYSHAGKVSEKTPLVMGHEASGIVDSIGSAVTRVKPGDRVAIEPGYPCRRCKQCKGGRYNVCPDMKFAAHPPTDGNLCRFFKIPEDFSHKIADSLSLEEAVLVEPLSVAVHAVRLAGLRPGQNVLVQGSGTIGLLVAAMAKAVGSSNVFVADIQKSKIDFAKSFTNCVTFVPDPTSTPEGEAERFKKEMNMLNGVDVVLECTGVESSAQTGLHVLTAGGVFVQIGMGKPEQKLPILAMCEKEIILKTSFRYGPGDYEAALDLLQSGAISVKALISNTVPFHRAAEAWEMTRRGDGIKNLIEGIRD